MGRIINELLQWISYNETVHVKLLDEFNYIIPHKISIVKIDVEGGEYDLLKGGIKFLKTHKPEFMYIEASCGKKDEKGIYEIERIYNLLINLGYTILRKVDCNRFNTDNILVKKNLI